MRVRRAGFTLVELMLVVVAVGVLARIAIPAYNRYTYMARAAAVLSEIQAIRVAAYAYNLDTNAWPADVNRGVVPDELKPYLPTGFVFQKELYALDWDNWVLPDGTPSRPETGSVVGISLTTDDEKFGRAFVELLGETAGRATISEHYTFIVVAAGP